MKAVFGLFVLCLSAFSQQQINFFAPSPSPPLVVTATANSPVGFSSLCYWVVANYPIGKSTPSNPSCIPNGNTASTVLVSWTGMLGATNYDVLRTTTPGLPAGANNIAVATAVSGTTQTDSFGALSSYTVSSAGSASATIVLDNLNHSSAGLYESLNNGAYFPLVTTGGGATNVFNNVTNNYTNVTQNFTNTTNTYTTGTDDFSADNHVIPHPVGTGAGKPATCKVGEEYFENDATAGLNLDLCTMAPSTWTKVGSGGPGFRHTCLIDNDTQSASVLTAAQFSGRCTIPAAATIVEVDIIGGTGVITGTASAPTVTGTSSIQLGKFTPNGGASTTGLLSAAAAMTAGKACVLTSAAGTCINGNTSVSQTITTTALAAGDILYVSAATADATQTWAQVAVIYSFN